MKLNNLRHSSAEHISQTLLYVMVGLCMMVFILFWTVGFDRPSTESANFNDPLFTNALIALMWLMLICAAGITVWSIVTTLKKRGNAQRYENGIPVKKISYGIILSTASVVLLTLLFASTTPIPVNGTLYADKLWLRITDMFVTTSLIMITAAVAAVVCSGWRNRKLHRKEEK